MNELPHMTLGGLREAYVSGEWTPSRLVEALDESIHAAEAAEEGGTRIWISRVDRENLARYAAEVESRGMESQPLYGVPFAIKDNIDLAGMPTTAGCPDYSYVPEKSAFVVQKLIDAGAIPMGKTNLDQFATGLVGVRSPYGFPKNPFNGSYIPGGSSSGSAVAVARGFAAFALGTDTAGSGRIPAAFNNLVGHKPTRGLLSTSGVVPACRTLDCVSIFAHGASETKQIFQCAAEYDPDDPFSRRDPQLPEADPLGTHFRFGVPRSDQLEFFGDKDSEGCYADSIAQMEAIGGEKVEIDFSPFMEAARLLYEGPWLAERFVGIEEILRDHAEILHPVTRQIIQEGGASSAADAFKAQYRLAELKRAADLTCDEVDLVVTPTAGRPYTVAEVEKEPLKLNGNLGFYMNFMNLLDYSAVACPWGSLACGIPFGVTLFSSAFHDEKLLDLADRFSENEVPNQKPETGEGWIKIAVCGAHMRGLPLNGQLTERHGRLLEESETVDRYRIYVLPATGDLPPRPGLVRVADGGSTVQVEVWALPAAQFGEFVAQIPPPLGIGKVELRGGELVPGFLCEAFAVENAEEISAMGGWRSYLTSARSRV